MSGGTEGRDFISLFYKPPQHASFAVMFHSVQQHQHMNSPWPRQHSLHAIHMGGTIRLATPRQPHNCTPLRRHPRWPARRHLVPAILPCLVSVALLRIIPPRGLKAAPPEGKRWRQRRTYWDIAAIAQALAALRACYSFITARLAHLRATLALTRCAHAQ